MVTGMLVAAAAAAGAATGAWLVDVEEGEAVGDAAEAGEVLALAVWESCCAFSRCSRWRFSKASLRSFRCSAVIGPTVALLPWRSCWTASGEEELLLSLME